MKTMKQKMLFAIALLTGITSIISCEEETDLKNKHEQHSIPIENTETGTASISNGFQKENLIEQAYKYYATVYGVTLSPENTKLIDEKSLHAWVEANEKNKHESINQKNKVALAELSAQGDVHALLVTAPAGVEFKKSVFIAGFTAIAITDIIDITTYEPRWILVKEGEGLYGCGCVEEYKIIRPGETYNECGRCPDLDDELPNKL